MLLVVVCTEPTTICWLLLLANLVIIFNDDLVEEVVLCWALSRCLSLSLGSPGSVVAGKTLFIASRLVLTMALVHV